jgi:hypothetical protein
VDNVSEKHTVSIFTAVSTSNLTRDCVFSRRREEETKNKYILVGKYQGRDHLTDVGTDGRKILKLIQGHRA